MNIDDASVNKQSAAAAVQPGVIKNESCATEASISIVSEPRAVATGSYAQLSINSYFVSYFLIRSHPPPQAGCPLGDPGPLAVLTRFVATLTFNHPRGDL